MNLSNELLMALNAVGWSLAIWLGKRQFDGMNGKIEALGDKINGLVTRGECQDIHNRIYARVDEIDAKSDSQGERLARVEVAAGK